MSPIKCIVCHFAKRGYQLDPNIIPFLSRLSMEEIDNIIEKIKPCTVVVTLQTLADTTGGWFIIGDNGQGMWLKIEEDHES